MMELVRVRFEQYAAQLAISGYALRVSNLSAEEFQRLHMDELVYRLVYRLAYLEDHEGVLEVPTTWWDAFKLRWFPSWLLNRYPPQWTQYQARTYLPHFPLPQGGSFDIEIPVWRSDHAIQATSQAQPDSLPLPARRVLRHHRHPGRSNGPPVPYGDD